MERIKITVLMIKVCIVSLVFDLRVSHLTSLSLQLCDRSTIKMILQVQRFTKASARHHTVEIHQGWGLSANMSNLIARHQVLIN